MATRILQRAGYDVVTANTGREVLGMPENGAAVDIVLMDLQRPVLDGLVATRRLREDPRWVDPPVIALTAHATGQR